MEVWKMAESVEAVAKGWLRARLPGRMAQPLEVRNERDHARRLADLHAECDALRGRMGRESYSA
ncbi:MAG: hypothetical protein RBT64_07645 [Trichloromonas sp.]|nr:hypothetical protein [Trichloromonas sp.]